MLANAASIIMLLLLAAWSVPGLADPPSYAPAHGWRRHHDHHDRHDRRDEDSDRHDEDDNSYVDRTREHRASDYGIPSGRCNREAIATALGGVVGGVVSSRLAKPDNRTVATIIGAAVGALIGKKIGHELDEADRGCFGNALEIGRPGRQVEWMNEATGVRYDLVPGPSRERNGIPCRRFTLRMVVDGEKSMRVGVACRSRAGLWQISE